MMRLRRQQQAASQDGEHVTASSLGNTQALPLLLSMQAMSAQTSASISLDSSARSQPVRALDTVTDPMDAIFSDSLAGITQVKSPDHKSDERKPEAREDKGGKKEG